MKRLIKKAEEQSLKEKLMALKPKFAEVAQQEYNKWNQDEKGYDDRVGYGGICHIIASKIADVCSKNNIKSYGMQAWTEEQHVWTVAYEEWMCSGEDECGDEDCEGEHTIGEVFIIDIPSSVYETGGGFTWKKIEDVEIEESDVRIFEITWEDFKNLQEEY